MNKIKNLIQRFTSSDIKTKQLSRNILSSFLIKGSSVIVSLFTVPAYMNYFSDQAILGVWFTAISILTWILNFDLGIGNGLRNHLVQPFIENNQDEIKKYISAAYISIGFIVAILSVVSLFVLNIVNWNSFFNIPPDIVNPETLNFMIIVLIIGILIQFWLKLINSILYALQLSSIPSFLTLISSVLILLFTVFFNTGDLDLNIKYISIAYIICINLPIIIVSIIIFRTKLSQLAPSLKYYSNEYAKKVIGLGGMFFYLQILTMIMFSTNEFFITWIVGPSKVVDFQVYNKLFSVFAMLFSLSLTPVWSAVTEAMIKKDYVWIRKLNSILNKILMLVIPLEIIVVIFLPWIVEIWLGNQSININYIYAIIFAIYYILFMKVKIDTSIIAGFGRLKVQSLALTLTVIIKIILTYVLTMIYPSWISIILANTIALVPYIVIEYFDIKNNFKLMAKGE